MPTLTLDRFEPVAEAFLHARSRGRRLLDAGQRPELDLVALYERDYPSLTSIELWADLHEAAAEDAGQKRAIQALLAGAFLEGRTVESAQRAASLSRFAAVDLEETPMAWASAPARWALTTTVSSRHTIEEAWRARLRTDIGPLLQRWQDELRAQLPALGGSEWSAFWAELDESDPAADAACAEEVLRLTEDAYTHALRIYFAQLELPLDDAWTSDADAAFRAPRFDAFFPPKGLMPAVIRTFRELGIEVEDQTNLHLDFQALAGRGTDVAVIPEAIPAEIHVQMRLLGGYLDHARALWGIGAAQQLVHTDRTLPFAARWLSDPVSRLGYGCLFGGLTRDAAWLVNTLQATGIEDYVVVAHLAWLYNVRRLAALTLFDRQLWRGESALGGLGADFVDLMASSLHVRVFPEQHVLPLINQPWSRGEAARRLRAEIFALHVRDFLRKEYDEEWQRNERAGRFLVQELWRPGGRYSAPEVLRFMGRDDALPPLFADTIALLTAV